MIPQATLCITSSPIHTVEYYSELADQLIEAGATEICLKDMAGIGRPAFLGRLTKSIKDKHPEIIIQYHGHSGPGLSMASILEVCKNGCDIIDTAVEPLSWGKVHPDVITIREMLKADGFQVKDLDMNAYMEVRSLTQKYIDDFLSYWIDPNNSQMSSLLVGCGLPGGMMGSMMADLKGFHGAINASLRAQGKSELTLDQLMVMLFQEVEYVWPRLGYPLLVTPFSQYVKNTALMNLMNILKGQPRWTTIDKDTWNMILGRMGQLPGQLDPEIIALAKQKGLEFYTGNPQDEFPNELEKYRRIMLEEGWHCGQDDEELFELAMHERQYRDFRSGIAKERFNKELADARAKANAPIIVSRPVVEMPKIDIDAVLEKFPDVVPVHSPVKGKMLWGIDVDDVSSAPTVGTAVTASEPVGFIQTYYGMEDVVPLTDGKIAMICVKQGENVVKGEIVAFIQR